MHTETEGSTSRDPDLLQLEQLEHPEMIRTYQDLRQAFKTFEGDYNIVGHPELPVRHPWEEPNPPGTYSLTQIPESMSEDEFLERVKGVTSIGVTCMDKDCAHSTWEKLKSGGANVMMITLAGGVVQHDLEQRPGATKAMNTMARYFAHQKREGNMPNLVEVHCDDHDSVCGAVKVSLGGVPLHELLSRWYGKPLTEHSPEEDLVMEALIRNGAQQWKRLFAGTGVEIVAELHTTDRKNPDKSRLVPINLGPEDPQVNIAFLLAVEESRTHGSKK